MHNTKCSTSYPKTLGTRLRSVKIKNKDSACASTLKCEIAVKISIKFRIFYRKFSTGARVFFARAGVFLAGAGGEKTAVCTALTFTTFVSEWWVALTISGENNSLEQKHFAEWCGAEKIIVKINITRTAILPAPLTFVSKSTDYPRVIGQKIRYLFVVLNWTFISSSKRRRLI